MSSIQPITQRAPIQAGAAVSRIGATNGAKRVEPFSDIFRSAISAVRETDREKTQLEYLMATGQLDNPALLTIASSKAQLSVDLLVQLRNKSMDAYNELMRTGL